MTRSIYRNKGGWIGEVFCLHFIIAFTDTVCLLTLPFLYCFICVRSHDCTQAHRHTHTHTLAHKLAAIEADRQVACMAKVGRDWHGERRGEEKRREGRGMSVKIRGRGRGRGGCEWIFLDSLGAISRRDQTWHLTGKAATACATLEQHPLFPMCTLHKRNAMPSTIVDDPREDVVVLPSSNDCLLVSLSLIPLAYRLLHCKHTHCVPFSIDITRCNFSTEAKCHARLSRLQS